MKPFAPKALGFFCLLASTGALHAVDLQNLVDRSPFAPASQSADGTGVAEPQGTWEFRGMATDAEGTAYSIFDTTTNKGRWVRAEDSNSPVQIKGFDPANNTLEIEQDGRALRLALKRAVIQSGQSVSAMTAAGCKRPLRLPLPNGSPARAAGVAGREGRADKVAKAVKVRPKVRRKPRNSIRPSRRNVFSPWRKRFAAIASSVRRPSPRPGKTPKARSPPPPRTLPGPDPSPFPASQPRSRLAFFGLLHDVPP